MTDTGSHERGLSPQAESLVDYWVHHPDEFETISKFFGERMRSRQLRQRSSDNIELLREQFELLTNGDRFTPGELVEWKPGLKNRLRPAYGEPVIVVQTLEEPIVSSKADSSSTYFREPLDIMLGFLDDDDELLIYHFDSRRFSHFSGEPGAPEGDLPQ